MLRFWGGEVNWGEIREAGRILGGGMFSCLYRFRIFFIYFKCMRLSYFKHFRESYHNIFAGMTGIVDYTSYDDMKYAVS